VKKTKKEKKETQGTGQQDQILSFQILPKRRKKGRQSLNKTTTAPIVGNDQLLPPKRSLKEVETEKVIK